MVGVHGAGLILREGFHDFMKVQSFLVDVVAFIKPMASVASMFTAVRMVMAVVVAMVVAMVVVMSMPCIVMTMVRGMTSHVKVLIELMMFVV